MPKKGGKKRDPTEAEWQSRRWYLSGVYASHVLVHIDGDGDCL